MAGLIKPSRRSFITGLAALITAPAIVRAGSLMPVKVMEAGSFTAEIAPSITLDEWHHKIFSYWIRMPDHSPNWQFVEGRIDETGEHYFDVFGKELVIRPIE